MEPKKLPRHDRPRGLIPKGHWTPKTVDGVRTAVLSCPSCGKVSYLTDHSISDNGKVLPSVVCPFACDFHEFVQLENWDAATDSR